MRARLIPSLPDVAASGKKRLPNRAEGPFLFFSLAGDDVRHPLFFLILGHPFWGGGGVFPPLQGQMLITGSFPFFSSCAQAGGRPPASNIRIFPPSTPNSGARRSLFFPLNTRKGRRPFFPWSSPGANEAPSFFPPLDKHGRRSSFPSSHRSQQCPFFFFPPPFVAETNIPPFLFPHTGGEHSWCRPFSFLPNPHILMKPAPFFLTCPCRKWLARFPPYVVHEPGGAFFSFLLFQRASRQWRLFPSANDNAADLGVAAEFERVLFFFLGHGAGDSPFSFGPL